MLSSIWFAASECAVLSAVNGALGFAWFPRSARGKDRRKNSLMLSTVFVTGGRAMVKAGCGLRFRGMDGFPVAPDARPSVPDVIEEETDKGP
jgi:hypothetical protein